MGTFNLHFSSIDISDNKYDEYKYISANGKKCVDKLSQINIFVGMNNSGKSRFLRKLFYDENIKFHADITNITEIDLMLDKMSSEFDRERISRNGTYFPEISEELEQLPRYEYLKEQVDFNIIIKTIRKYLNKYSHIDLMGGNTQSRSLAVLKRYEHFFSNAVPKSNGVTFYKFSNIYIPTLRGLRPIQISSSDNKSFSNNNDNYFHRTAHNYFSSELRKESIYTGLNLYRVLQEYSHGEQEKQAQLANFETFLSTTFFNNKPVKLTPRINKDVPYVRIDKRDTPIYDLGDGIQSLIILTYPLFFNQNEVLKIYIEEPETHLHPGYQRVFFETLLRPEFKTFQYFITTHSNHFLDITLDDNSISVYTFEQTRDLNNRECFQITNVENSDTNILSIIGVKNSSVFLSNCTIWVEGISDRIYLRKIIEIIQKNEPIKYKEDTHFSFVEFGGNNITHWSFLDSEDENHRNILVERLCGKLFLLTDSDNSGFNKDGSIPKKPGKKALRNIQLKDRLKDRFYCLECREIENLLSPNVLCSIINQLENWETDNSLFCKNISYKSYQKEYLGRYIEKNIKGVTKRYSSDSGSILNKVDFSKKAVEIIRDINDLSAEAILLGKNIYNFIHENNRF